MFGFVLATRLLFSSQRTVFSLSPDELANAGMARHLAGGEFVAFTPNTYQPATSMLLAPVFWVIDHPDAQFRAALVLVAALAGIGAVVLSLLVHRLTGFSATASALVAVALSSTPGALVGSNHLWAEPLVTLTFLAGTLLLLRLYDDPSLGAALRIVAIGLVAYLAHGRMLPFAALLTVLAALALREKRPVHVAGVLLFGFAGVFAVRSLSNRIFDAVWIRAGDTNSEATILEGLLRPLEVLDAAAGQFWYLLASSFLLVAYGIAEGVRRLRQPTQHSRDACLLLTLTVPLVATSIVFMSDRPRVDHLIYGRYNDAIVAPLSALGLWWLIGCWNQRSRNERMWTIGVSAALLVELGAFVQVFHKKQLAQSNQVTEMIAGISPFMRGSVLNAAAVTVQALVLSLGLVACVWLVGTGRLRPPTAAVFAACLVVLLAVLAFARLDRPNDFAGSAVVRTLVDDPLTPDRPIGVAIVREEAQPAADFWQQSTAAMLYQWQLPGSTDLKKRSAVLPCDLNDLAFAEWRHAKACQRHSAPEDPVEREDRPRGQSVWPKPVWPQAVVQNRNDRDPKEREQALPEIVRAARIKDCHIGPERPRTGEEPEPVTEFAQVICEAARVRVRFWNMFDDGAVVLKDIAATMVADDVNLGADISCELLDLT